MALEQKLSQKLSQRLAITPQVRMGIELLELGRLEVEQYLQDELSRNPTLEDVSKEPEDGGEAQSARETAGERPETPTLESSPGEGGTGVLETPALPAEQDAKPKVDWEDYLEQYQDWRGANTPRGLYDDDERPSLEATVSRPENLVDHILEQIRLGDISSEDEQIVHHIIGNLDKNGYLCSPLDEIAAACGVSPEKVEAVLEFIRHLDPPGIGARDLQECLLIQLDHLGLGDGLAARIVRDHLDKLEKQRFDQIAKVEQVTVDEVIKAVSAIRNLEPRPGRPFSEDPARYIVPDVYVHRIGDEYVITLNEDGLPKLRVSGYYLQLMRDVSADVSPEKSYLRERLKAATFLIDSLHRRQRTIYKVTESIVKFQREFLDQGIEYLRPLVQKEVADDIGVSESTVSRVTSGKYVHTPQGLFELKFFFSSGFRTSEGEVSSSSIKAKIKNLVAAESVDNPLSDQQIVELLGKENIHVARRTVAKYREALGIASSARRKKRF